MGTPRGTIIEDAYNKAREENKVLEGQTIEELQKAQQQFIDAANAVQQQQNEQWAAARSAFENSLNEANGGVEAILNEGQKRLQREQEIAQAEYLASQKAAQVSGLSHLATSLGNLIGVGFFNAPHSDYVNPSVEWMRKADQDKQIARQRMDNLRDRQRQIQLQQIQMKMSGAGQLAGMDMDNARQTYQHGINMANAQREGAKDIANVRSQYGQQAIEMGLQGTTARINAEYQDATLAEQRRDREERAQIQREQYAAQNAINMARYGLQQDPETGAITPIINPATGLPIGNVSGRSSSGSGSSTSGNNYKVTVDGKEIVLGMNKETYTTAIQSGKKAIQQDVMDEAGFEGTWEEFVEAASESRIPNPNGRGKVKNPLNEYADIINALNNNGNTMDNDEAKRIEAIIEDYVTRNSDTANNFNKHLVDVSNRQALLREQTSAVSAQTPSQQGNTSMGASVPEQPTEVRLVDGKYVTVDTATGEVVKDKGNWETNNKWK